ncbi:hypothetical protein [Streptomyces tropicalis]|uniref:Uncharacterized protein n=1 Tax=Streptomyces tropicalis TaxID=3034234 RepID=A0ABT6A4D5_9ACTN|nr:hypothetical protein [Streptomyces tropicalis]MDF3299485.1 hypothetical protein [Streptomyces tropicalis]
MLADVVLAHDAQVDQIQCVASELAEVLLDLAAQPVPEAVTLQRSRPSAATRSQDPQAGAPITSSWAVKSRTSPPPHTWSTAGHSPRAASAGGA